MVGGVLASFPGHVVKFEKSLLEPGNEAKGVRF